MVSSWAVLHELELNRLAVALKNGRLIEALRFERGRWHLVALVAPLLRLQITIDSHLVLMVLVVPVILAVLNFNVLHGSFLQDAGNVRVLHHDVILHVFN